MSIPILSLYNEVRAQMGEPSAGQGSTLLERAALQAIFSLPQYFHFDSQLWDYATCFILRAVFEYQPEKAQLDPKKACIYQLKPLYDRYLEQQHVSCCQYFVHRNQYLQLIYCYCMWMAAREFISYGDEHRFNGFVNKVFNPIVAQNNQVAAQQLNVFSHPMQLNPHIVKQAFDISQEPLHAVMQCFYQIYQAARLAAQDTIDFGMNTGSF